MRKTILNLTALLVLMAPHCLFAETVTDTNIEEKKITAPNTPEDFLMLLRLFREDNQHVNGFEIGEKIFGITRGNWGNPAILLNRGLEGSDELFQYTNIPSSPYVSHEDNSPIMLDEHDDLLSLYIGFSKKSFCVTPAITKAILGEPEESRVGQHTHLEYKMRRYNVSITYKLKNATNTAVTDRQGKTGDNHKSDDVLTNSCGTYVQVRRVWNGGRLLVPSFLVNRDLPYNNSKELLGNIKSFLKSSSSEENVQAEPRSETTKTQLVEQVGAGNNCSQTCLPDISKIGNPKEVQVKHCEPAKRYVGIGYDHIFNLTPKATREVLGPPSGIRADIGIFYPFPNLQYSYESKCFEVRVWFKKDMQISNSSPSEFLKTQNAIALYENHKDFYAYKIQVSRKEYNEDYASKAKTININAPKTQEALLTLLKDFIAKPQTDRFDFAEKIFGLSRENWGEARQCYEKDTDYHDYRPYEDRFVYYSEMRSRCSKSSLYGLLRAGGYGPPSVPYESSGLIDDGKYDFRELDVYFNRYMDTFGLTPALTYKILGKPAGLFVEITNSSGAPVPEVLYTYETDKYEIKIRYTDKTKYWPATTKSTLEEKAKTLASDLNLKKKLGKEDILSAKKDFAALEKHKDLTAISISIKRKEYERNYSEWSKTLKVNYLQTPAEVLLHFKKLDDSPFNEVQYVEKNSGTVNGELG